MKDITIFLEELMEKTEFPVESRDTFRDALKKYLASPECQKEFDEIYYPAYANRFAGVRDIIEKAMNLGTKMGIHEYTSILFFWMYAAYYLKNTYEEEGMDMQIYWDSMLDLKAKLIECHNVDGVWGSFLAGAWFRGFFNRTRFALGRLQFEETHFDMETDYTYNGYTVKPEETVIGMHIPSLGKLPIEAVYDSFERAYKFFPHCVREDGIMVFVCGSWLLYEENKTFFPQGNLMKFIELFDVIRNETDYDRFHDCWRVFNKNDITPYEDQPQDTALRKAYVKHLSNGGLTGSGYGVILFDGKNIINK